MTPEELAAVRERLEEFTAEMFAPLSRSDQRVKGQTYLERGEDNPSLHLALRIAEFFRLPVQVVFSTRPFPRISDTAAPDSPAATG